MEKKKTQSHFKEVDHKRLTICQTQVCLTHTHTKRNIHAQSFLMFALLNHKLNGIIWYEETCVRALTHRHRDTTPTRHLFT